MVMAIVCTMTANAQEKELPYPYYTGYKEVYFATHRFVQNEFGEVLPNSHIKAYCPTRIELDITKKTLLIKTKTHGAVSYTFSDVRVEEKFAFFLDRKDNLIGGIIYTDASCQYFKCLVIYRNNDTRVIYEDIDEMLKN